MAYDAMMNLLLMYNRLHILMTIWTTHPSQTTCLYLIPFAHMLLVLKSMILVLSLVTTDPLCTHCVSHWLPCYRGPLIVYLLKDTH